MQPEHWHSTITNKPRNLRRLLHAPHLQILRPFVLCPGSRFTGQISAQGKTVGGGEDWVAMSMGFSQAGATGGGSGSAFGGGH